MTDDVKQAAQALLAPEMGAIKRGLPSFGYIGLSAEFHDQPRIAPMTSQINETSTAKTLLHKVIEAQPDDASYEEIIRELAFERMVERGLADVRAGRSVSHQEALQRICSWRS